MIQEVIDAQSALTALPLQWDYFLCSAVPSARNHCTRRPQLLTPTLLWQAPQHPSNGSLDFVSLPRRPHSFLKPPQRSGLSARHHSLSPPPQVHRNFLVFCLFWVFFTGAAPPHPVFLLEVSALTNRRLASVYSASAPGVMGAVEPHPLGRTVASSRRLSLAPSGPHHSLMQKTGLFSPGVKVPLGNDFTVPTF